MENIQIKNILVTIDFTPTSQMALNEAIRLAKLLNAEIQLLHISEYNQFMPPFGNEIETFAPDTAAWDEAIQKRLDTIVNKLKTEHSLNVNSFIEYGSIAPQVLEFCENNSIDLIVMGTHGASGYKEFFIGSNAQRVVTLAEVPVLTMQKEIGEKGFKNILIPIDDSIHSRQKLNMALVFAKLYQAHIHLLGLPDSKEEADLNKFKIKMKSVEDLVASQNLSYTEKIVHESSLAKAANDYAEKNKCDLIVINTGHESEITGIFLGAFAQQIVNHSKIPVLSIRHIQDAYSVDTSGFGI